MSWAGKNIAFGIWLLIVSNLAVQDAAAEGTVGLVKGQSYSTARSQLLADGWKPVRSADRRPDGSLEKTVGDAGTLLSLGMVEVAGCAGTGLGNCEFRWRRGSTCLGVFTIGEYSRKRGFPRVHSYYTGDCKTAFDGSH